MVYLGLANIEIWFRRTGVSRHEDVEVGRR